jgi:hypothetical protein
MKEIFQPDKFLNSDMQKMVKRASKPSLNPFGKSD